MPCRLTAIRIADTLAAIMLQVIGRNRGHFKPLFQFNQLKLIHQQLITILQIHLSPLIGAIHTDGD
jgi:hypothetical protein